MSYSKLYLSGIEIEIYQARMTKDEISKLYLSGIEMSLIG